MIERVKINRPDDLLPENSQPLDTTNEIEPVSPHLQQGMVQVKGGIWMAKEAVGIRHVTVKDFFLDSVQNGFAYKKDFLSLLYEIDRGELQSLKILFELMAVETAFNVSHGERVGPKGQTSVKCSYVKDEIPYVLYIRTTGDMHRLLWQYEFSILTCQVTLEGLYAEAQVMPHR